MASMPSPKAAARRPGIDLKRLFGGKSGYGAEVARQRDAEQARRDAADNLLLPDHIGGKTGFESVLLTTLGNGAKTRPITAEDLRQFKRIISAREKSLASGITAKTVLDHSLDIDIARANAQIHVAALMSANRGELHFITNSGPDSDVARHHVHVMFADFPAWSASPADPAKIAASMLKDRLLFDCDCGRFNFWLRYMATLGNYCAGRQEQAFPKIRNPNLVGLGCKHVLRVMTALQKDPTVKAGVVKMLEAVRGTRAKPVKVSAQEAREHVQKQLDARNRGNVSAKVESAAMAKARKDAARKTPAAQRRALAQAAKLAEKQAAAKAREGQLAEAANKMKGLLGTLSKDDAKRLLEMMMGK
jgi:hypothetical protein